MQPRPDELDFQRHLDYIHYNYLIRDDVYAAAVFAADYLAQEEIIFANGQRL